MSELPKGWTLVSFDEIAAQEKGAIRRGPFGGSLKKEIFVSNGYKVYEQQNAIRNDFDIGSYYIDENKYKEMMGFNVYPNDIIISCAGTIGKVAIVPNGAQQGIINQALMRIRPNLFIIIPRYLKLYLESPLAKKEIFEQSVGTALKNLAAISEIKKTSIPLPPLNEQRRIVAKLDSLFARSRRAREELGRIPKLIERYKQAILAAACSGRLTADWREQNNRSEDWIETTVGKLIDGIDAGINVKCEERLPLPHEFALVKISAVTWGTYDDDKSKTLPPGQSVPESTRIKVGDFLISRANTLELVGACVIVERVTRPVFLSDKVLRILVQENYKKWLLLWLRSKDGRYQIEQLASGNQLSMRNLSQANLKSIKLKLPPEDERNEIISKVEKLFKAIDLMAQEYQKASQLLDRLEQATLAKAFRGELVPQDPNDEPAAALLERIQAEKPAQAKGKAVKSKQKPGEQS